MKFYITEETKQEIEAKIAELEYLFEREGEKFDSRDSGKYYLLKEINSSATIIPVEKDMEDVIYKHNMDEYRNTYPNGVIIQHKQ